MKTHVNIRIRSRHIFDNGDITGPIYQPPMLRLKQV
ncbi:MAG: hypothetical protein ACI9C4_000199, partial [Paraglaciecola sp.]